ncbi:DPP10, partial [Rhyzopertha dominica]
ELVVSSPNERNWRGIFIALLVIVAVLGLIVFSIVLVSPPEEGPRVKGRKPTLEDIILKLPPPPRFNGSWISDTEFVYKDSHGGITLYNAENLTTKILMTNSTFRQYNAVDFKVASDLRFVLLLNDVNPVNTYTKVARYFIRKPLSNKELDESAPFLQYATWSPDGSAVAFVHRNDVYYKPKVQKDLVCRITKTGGTDIYNGVPDWLYENEILKTSHALWFSPDGSHLMYLTFNDTLVDEYKYTWYDGGSPIIKYPRIKTVRYPKPETLNPEVTVWIVNLARPKYLFPQQIKPTNSVEPDSYITSASFFGENNVAIVWLNRKQNVSVTVTCRSKNGFNCTDFHIEKESKEPIFHPVFSYNGAQALVRLPVQDGENGHYMHACQLFDGNVVPLTHGPFELTRILAWDEENHLIYALATIEEQPGTRHLFKIGDTNSSQPWTCLTCHPKLDFNSTFYDLEETNETILNKTMLAHYNCEFNNVIFSLTYKYYVQECLGPSVPVLFLVETATNVRLAVLNNARTLRNIVAYISAPQVKNIQVEIEDGYRAQVRLFLPPVLREYEDVTFPMILIVDGSPGSQTVSCEWKLSWAWYLASTRNYIVAHIDARGSGFQGERMRREIQNRIGSIEVQDQLAVVTYLRDTFKFIDRTKICAAGRGYGGYVSAMMLLEDFHQVLNCSVSISPITNWRYHNSYFTERYLGQPSKQPQNYDNADLTMRAGNLYNRQYLLIHGTADTVVVPQHSMMFAKALIEQGVIFQQVVYPDENHSFSKKTLLHMYKEIDQFFNDSFGPVIDDWDDGSVFLYNSCCSSNA